MDDEPKWLFKRAWSDPSPYWEIRAETQRRTRQRMAAYSRPLTNFAEARALFNLEYVLLLRIV